MKDRQTSQETWLVSPLPGDHVTLSMGPWEGVSLRYRLKWLLLPVYVVLGRKFTVQVPWGK